VSDLDPQTPESWDSDTIIDVVYVLDALRDDELKRCDPVHVNMAATLDLIAVGEDGIARMTDRGELMLLGWRAAVEIAEVEKGLLLMEIGRLESQLQRHDG
jgi:hypothetical protein